MTTAQMHSLGTLLRRYRVAAELTQEELAARAGVSARTVSDLERGLTRRSHQDTLRLLAEALQLSTEERREFGEAAQAARASRSVGARPDQARLVPGPRYSVPAALTPFTPLVGREQEEAIIAHLLLRDDVRLLTLTGPAGVGKTRLALQAAVGLQDAFSDGVCYVELASVREPILVLPTVVQALGLHDARSQSLADYLHKRHLLLVLDNFEQVIAAAPEIAVLLATCSELKILATSRATLHVRGEYELVVPPLALPDPSLKAMPDELEKYAAPALFVQRARAARLTFALTPANAEAVLSICRHLDGLPLAIELAAPRIKLFSPQMLLARLSQRLEPLTSSALDVPERHRSLQRAMSWSYNLLDPHEQALFCRLAVFVGGWTLEAAELVCRPAEFGLDVVQALSSLVDKSLVRLQDTADGEPRFTMLETIREYGLERLEESGEAEALKRAHATYYVAFAEREWAADMEAIGAAVDLAEANTHIERLQPEQGNMRAALTWLRAQAEMARRTGGTEHCRAGRAVIGQADETFAVEGLRLAGALLWPWANGGQFGEGRGWLDTFLALDSDPAIPALGDASGQAVPEERGGGISPSARHSRKAMAERSTYSMFARARALYAVGVLAYWQGDTAQAIPPLEQSLTLWQTLNDQRGAGYAVNNLGLALQDQGDLARAHACHEQCLTLGRTLGNWDLIGMPLTMLGNLALTTGDLEQAAVYSDEALVIYRQGYVHGAAAACLIVQASLALRSGHLGQAASLTEEALVLLRAVRDERQYGAGLEGCALICAAQGHAEQAARMLGAAAASRERIGMHQPMRVPTAGDVEAAVAATRAALGEAAWEVAFAAGRTLTQEEAISEALDETEDGGR